MSEQPKSPESAAPAAAAVKFTFDPDRYTVDELEEIEELARVTVAEAAKTGTLSVRLVRAIAFVTLKRSGSKVSFAEMGGWTATQLGEAVQALPPA